jgi:hypothetical protein
MRETKINYSKSKKGKNNMKLTLKQEIMKLNSLSELNEISSFVKECKTLLGKSALSVGANVFVVQKTKKTPGVITKMNIKKAIVEMSGMKYNVPFSMLELA